MLFKLFYSTLAGYTQTQFAGNSTNTSAYNPAETQLHHTLAHICIHTVFLTAACCCQASHGAVRCDIITLCRSVLPDPPTPPPPPKLPIPFRCCMSVSQCNLWFHVRLGSNDHNNNDNGNNIYNNNLLLCVCTVPGWCSVQFSLSLKWGERGSRMHILQLV